LKTIRVDQGSEFVSRDLDLWAYQKDVTLDFFRPGKPPDNALSRSTAKFGRVAEPALVPDP
jgi:putative transposase